MLNRITRRCCLLLAGLAVIGNGAAARANDCTGLKSLELADVRISLAEDINGGGTWLFPPSVFNVLAGPNPGTNASFCRVKGVIEKEIGFEVWLPKEWNDRFQGVGNGGFSGGLNYPAMNAAVTRGFATASTDTGHVTPDHMFDVSWIRGHPDRVENFGHRAHHLLAVTAKKIIAAYYGKGPKKSYYMGCSSGGWQGLTEAQKYPDDYDGIVAGAPANNFVRLQSRDFWVNAMKRANPQGMFGKPEVELLIAAAYAKCDPVDGVKDGIISHPRSCNFTAQELVCREGQAEGCLTKAQADLADKLYGPETTEKGLSVYPGNAYGVTPFLWVPVIDQKLALTEIITPDQRNWTPETFDPDRDIPELEDRLSDSLSAWKTDLSSFKERGGKLITYHGWTDPWLSPYNTVDYFLQVRKTMGADRQDQFFRLFMVPGMDHCRGGVGPDRFDMIGAIMKWVEEGKAPDQVIASGVEKESGAVIRTRPLCPYPQVAVYNGEGDTDQASSFACRRAD